jgi:opacity protein-like surface antigen
MRRTIEIFLVLVLFSLGLSAQQPVGPRDSQAGSKKKSSLAPAVLARVGYFNPTESAFRDIYGAGLIFGGELRLSSKSLGFWLEGSHLGRTGELSYTGEATEVKITAVEGGVLYTIKPGKVAPYAGAGIGYYQYKESNVIGESKQNKAGFCAVAGVSLDFTSRLFGDFRLKYSSCSIKPADFKVNIGGLTAGIGLGFRF